MSRYFPGFSRSTVETPVVAGKAWRWDFKSGRPLGPALRHRADITSVAFSPDGKKMLTGSTDGTAQIWNVPAPLTGTAEQVAVWAQLMTGIELDDVGTVGYLSSDEWHERRERLKRLGGTLSIPAARGQIAGR